MDVYAGFVGFSGPGPSQIWNAKTKGKESKADLKHTGEEQSRKRLRLLVSGLPAFFDHKVYKQSVHCTHSYVKQHRTELVGGRE